MKTPLGPHLAGAMTKETLKPRADDDTNLLSTLKF